MMNRLSDPQPLFVLSRGSVVAYLAAFVLMFVLLSVAGRFASKTDHLHNLARIHPPISPQGLYYPTASELVAYVNATTRQDQIAVVIGGSSVMRGDGQPVGNIWTENLQRELGDRYRVFNFAMASGMPTEHGGVAAQALVKDGRRVIFVGDALLYQFGAPDGIEYRYVFYDALYKGMLLENPERDVRLRVHRERNARASAAAPTLHQSAMLDSWLYFTDLWNAFGYTTMFSAWSPYIDLPFGAFRPRRTIPDLAVITLEASPQRFLRIPESERTVLLNHLAGFACGQSSTVLLNEFEADARAGFPESFRAQTVLVLPRLNPFFLQFGPAEQRACYQRSYELAEARVLPLGYTSAPVGVNLVEEDFTDRIHLTESGGVKLAQDVAPLVRSVARRLGYE